MSAAPASRSPTCCACSTSRTRSSRCWSKGALTEGHGRALLMAPDHADRRRLARTAVEEGWTVRETEARARDAARPPAGEPEGHAWRSTRTRRTQPIRLGDAFGRAFGTDVKVKPRGTGYTVALSFDSLDEALQLARTTGRVARYHAASRAISSVG